MSSYRKRTRSSSRIRDENENGAEEAVANVNREDSSAVTRNSKERKTNRQTNRNRTTSRRATEVRFTEDDQEVRMEVSDNEENELDADKASSDEEDPEIILGSSQNNFRDSFNNNATITRELEEGEVEETEQPRPSTSNEPKKIKKRRLDDAEREEVIGETLSRVQQIFDKSGFTETASLLRQHFAKEGKIITEDPSKLITKEVPMVVSDNQADPKSQGSRSEETFYKNAVMDETNLPIDRIINVDNGAKRISSSSEEGELINTSDELDRTNITIDQLIAETRKEGRVEQQGATAQGRDSDRRPMQHYQQSPEERADDLIKQVEKSKARIFPTPGENFEQIVSRQCDDEPEIITESVKRANMAMGRSALAIDEDYLLIGGHVEDSVRIKIEKGEYVDLAKLIQKDKILAEDDRRLNMVIKNGQAFWIPSSEGLTNINNFNCWQQAFRVYSDIFARHNPDRAAELIQYSHVINTISTQFVWDNVYAYDRDFRMHMQRNPDRKWSNILHPAWFMRLRDRLTNNFPQHSGTSNFQKGGGKTNDICRRFSRGRCTYGRNCRYEHRCSYCNKFGHPVVQCRKAAADRESTERGTKNENNNLPPKINNNNANVVPNNNNLSK